MQSQVLNHACDADKICFNDQMLNSLHLRLKQPVAAPLKIFIILTMGIITIQHINTSNLKINEIRKYPINKPDARNIQKHVALIFFLTRTNLNPKNVQKD